MKRIIPIFLLLSVLLMGCSSGVPDSIKVQLLPDSFTVDGKTVDISSYNGYSASKIFDTEDNIKFKLIEAEDLTIAEGNVNSVLEENMDKYKSAKTFSLYLNTFMVMYYPLGNNMYIYAAYASNTAGLEQMKLSAYNICEQLALTNGEVICEFGDKLNFKSGMDTLVVTPEYASISGVMKVSYESKAECVTPYVITQNEKDYQLYTYSTNKYVYYQYGDILIQTLLGLDLNQYLEFK